MGGVGSKFRGGIKKGSFSLMPILCYLHIFVTNDYYRPTLSCTVGGEREKETVS